MATSVPALTGDNGEIVVTPQTGAPTGSPNASIAAASEAARQALAAGTLGQEPAPASGETGRQQPRASDGTFGRPLPTPTDAAPEGGREGESASNAPAEGEQAPVGGAPAEGQQGAEGEEGSVDPAIAARTVTLPVDGEEIDLDVGDEKIAGVVRGALERAAQADAIRETAEQEIADAMAVREQVDIDPVGFALSRLKGSPAGQDHLALSLLAQPEVWERLRPTIEEMVNDPNALRTISAEQRAARAEYRERAQHEVAEQRAVSQNLAEIQAACAAMATMNPALSREQQETAYNDMLRDLMAYADRANATTIPVETVPVLLARRLTALGVNPVEAASRAAEAAATRSTNGGRRPVAPPARPTATARPAARRPAPPPTGQQFVASQERRKAVAIPAAGAGSPSVGPDLVPPKKADGSPMNVAETLAWHRQSLAKGRRALTR